MYPVQTLQDFALGLLTDEAARTAFQSDPQGVLDAAGLGDLSPLDVQEVLPLVADQVASPDLGLGTDLVDDLGLGADLVDDLDADVLTSVHDLAAQTAVADVVGDNLRLDDVLTGDLTSGIGQITHSAVDLHDIAQTGDVIGDIGNVTSGVGVGEVGSIDDLTAVQDVADIGKITDVV
ncbi:IniB N-terminal domain-containing protein, partial [Actinosynnema sp. NPDC059797]